jgi:hypothetical protein
MATAKTPTRQDLVCRGQRLEYSTVVWNSVEALVSIVAGLIAGAFAHSWASAWTAYLRLRPGRRCYGGFTMISIHPCLSRLHGPH